MNLKSMCSFQFQPLRMCLKLMFSNKLAQLMLQSPWFKLVEAPTVMIRRVEGGFVILFSSSKKILEYCKSILR